MNKHTNELPVSRFCLNLWLGNVTPLECKYFMNCFMGGRKTGFVEMARLTTRLISALGIEE